MPTAIEFERKKYAKDLIQPFVGGRPNDAYVKEYGTSAYKETGDLDIKQYYDKKLTTDPKMIHINNSVSFSKEIPKGEVEKPKGCQHEFDASLGGGFIDGCIKCGFKLYNVNS